MEEYKLVLSSYIQSGREEDLGLAYEIGRKAIETGYSLLQIVDIHTDSLKQLDDKDARYQLLSERASEVLKEVLAPFEMTRMGYLDTISILRTQNEKLRELMEERSNLLKEREDFMMVVTHDLKTPVIAEGKCLNFLLEGDFGELTPDQQEVLSAMKDSNRHLFGMLKNLLEAYKYDHTTPTLWFAPIDLIPLLTSCFEDFKFAARMKNVVLEPPIFEGEHHVVIADEASMRHIMANLIDNALKFTQAGGHVRLKLTDYQAGVRIEVQDTGVGISEEDLAHLFERFYQAAAGRKRKTGMGLGLHLCHQMILAQGGHIACSSEPGQGTTFSIILGDTDCSKIPQNRMVKPAEA
ncbi:MAG: hypothetical protein K2W95_08235 [Candidatus Obscuribacterales bacterium]|nr:hypothetical protein [Candidatus Obscuribacterales bacterium]